MMASKDMSRSAVISALKAAPGSQVTQEQARALGIWFVQNETGNQALARLEGAYQATVTRLADELAAKMAGSRSRR
jgi:hypothetical protein